MSANVETMFSVRETPWHGLGRIVMDAPASREALELAGLDWRVESRNIYSGTGAMIPGYRANVRSTDDAVLGVVSERYCIVQNEEAFQFTDDLLGEGVTYETAGSLQGGKKVWMLAKLPEKYIIAGDEVTPYLVFFNSHDGSSGVKVAMTPVRVVCQNTLNLALGTAKRIWTARHTENVLLRVQDARETLQLANGYMTELGKGIHELTTIKLSDRKVQEFINEFFPITDDLIDGQRKNNLRFRIAKTGIIFQNLRTIRCKHKTKENDSLKWASFCSHCVHCRLIYIFPAEFIYLFCVERTRGESSHSARIQSLITVLSAFMILCGCHCTDSFSIYK